MINDRTPGAEVYEDVVSRLAPEPGQKKIDVEGVATGLPTGPKKRGGFLRRRKEEVAVDG